MSKCLVGNVSKFLNGNMFTLLSRAYKVTDKFPLLPGGGLDKLQGGIKEEKYFNNQDQELINKIREEPSNLKCENCFGDWAEYEKTLQEKARLTTLPQTCSSNKQKNCQEEAYFINEYNECCKLLNRKFNEQQDNNVQFNDDEQAVTSNSKDDNATIVTETDIKKIPPMK